MKDFEVIMINIGYFIFQFISVWNWDISFHLFPIFKTWCESRDTKISQSTAANTRECHFQWKCWENGFSQGKERKRKQNPNIDIC